MIPIPNLELVLIIPEKVEETFKLGDKEGQKSQSQVDNEKKAQSRGTVFAVGDNVQFWQKEDLVSFHRAGAVEIKDGEITYLCINQSGILCKFISNVKE